MAVDEISALPLQSPGGSDARLQLHQVGNNIVSRLFPSQMGGKSLGMWSLRLFRRCIGRSACGTAPVGRSERGRSTPEGELSRAVPTGEPRPCGFQPDEADCALG
eukprot:6226483-Pyramimonas_sp.AAC.2